MSNRPQRTDPSKTDPELLTRTSWVNAEVAYRQVKRGRVDGNTCALWLRLHLQRYLYGIGCFLQLHCGKVAFLGLLMLSLCCVGLKTGHLETNVDELWVEVKVALRYSERSASVHGRQAPRVKGSTH
ncbi:patched protein [Plakobranchus ocellatus]|uniref:Patched protein n=1 Tax=Plakobranchus ocellatus TaxID=259542 RepID=A0AAV3YZZ3_9GAST|nr:patched protein [Plakobranchus ocellatus]